MFTSLSIILFYISFHFGVQSLFAAARRPSKTYTMADTRRPKPRGGRGRGRRPDEMGQRSNLGKTQSPKGNNKKSAAVGVDNDSTNTSDCLPSGRGNYRGTSRGGRQATAPRGRGSHRGNQKNLLSRLGTISKK